MFPVKRYPLNRSRRVNPAADESRLVSKAMQRFFHKLINERADNAESDANSDHSDSATQDGSLLVATSGLTLSSFEPTPVGSGPAPERWSEQFSVHDFKRVIGFEHLNLRERYDGALSSVVELNPPSFVLAHGSIIICIKTETEYNFVWSVRHNKWGNNRKVNDRIQQVWDEKREHDKIYFLFSVNGSSQYCGLAEMIGPVQRDAELDGWEHNYEGAPTEGATPITFIYVKNVRFPIFKDLEPTRIGHSITNMWCGMHFPQDIARQVVKAYVEAPHCENCLVEVLRQEDDTASNESRQLVTNHLGGRQENTYRGTDSFRGAREDLQPNPPTRTDMVLAAHSWRHEREEPTSGLRSANATTDSALYSRLNKERAVDDKMKANDFKLDAKITDARSHSRKEIVLATYDQNGTLRPYKRDSQVQENPLPKAIFTQLDGHSPLSNNYGWPQTLPSRTREHGGVALPSRGIEPANVISNNLKIGQSIHDSLRGTKWFQLQDFSQAIPSTALYTTARPARNHGPVSCEDVFYTPSTLGFEQPPQSAPPQPVKMTFPIPQGKLYPLTPGGTFKFPLDSIYPLPSDATPHSSEKRFAAGKAPMPSSTGKLADIFSIPRWKDKIATQHSSITDEHSKFHDGKTGSANATTTPQRSHHARGSEFSQSFDARVKTDLSKIIESPDYSSYSRRGRLFTPESPADTSAEDMSRCLRDFKFASAKADAESPHSRFGSSPPSSPNYTIVSQ